MESMDVQKREPMDLEQRMIRFAKDVRDYVKKLPHTISNIEYSRQLIRSSASIAANYMEARESLGKKDEIMRLRISKKEARESKLWVDLTEPYDAHLPEKERLFDEAHQLMKIVKAITIKVLNRP